MGKYNLITPEGKTVFTGTENECFGELQNRQPQSTEWAIKNEGWKIEPVNSVSDETKYNGWSNYDTWCANLWLNNDENLYKNFIHALKMKQGKIMSIQALLKNGLKQNIINDTINTNNVNFDEIITNNMHHVQN